MEKIKNNPSKEKFKDKDREIFPSSSTVLSEEQFKRLSTYIETELGIKMPPAKKIMLESRLQKRIRALHLTAFEEYLDLVFSDAATETELFHMIDAVTTNKTDFFREPDHFDYMRDVLLPERYNRSSWGNRNGLRVWSTASSSGEEPYTIAMILQDFKEQVNNFRYAVLGTDISTDMLERGRKAVYTEERVIPIPQAYKKRYLLRNKDRSSNLYRVVPELRRRVMFHRLNLMADDFGIDERFEIIFCRNVIIYFDRQNQSKLLRKLYNYLIPGGYLFLGHSETLAGMELPLYSVAPTIYRKPE
ncbi:MAG: CheR family methyltransferase [Spirochaetia bacterium]